MKAVLISIQPKWCELIASGKKTVEVRKTKPKIETPFKCYIYQTKKTWIYNIYSMIADWQGKVIGEFVCGKINCFTTDYRKNEEQTNLISKLSCLSLSELCDYESNLYCLYGWHISDLKIYDKPKELSEFKHYVKKDWWDYGHTTNKPIYEIEALTKAPQSWQYVEESES